MKYREFGNTGLEVSVLGFGCMRFPVIGKDNARIDEGKAMDMVRHAIDQGVNYIDTAYPYHSADFSKGGSSEPFLAKALKDGYRAKVHLATKLPAWLVHSRSDMDKFLDEQVQRLDTESIDLYLLHALKRTTWDKLLKHDVIGFLNKALDSGKIKYAGFSFHDDTTLFKEVVDAYDWSFCQIQYNYFDEHFQAGVEGLKYAHEKGLAVVIMEPLRGGYLVNRLPEQVKQIFRETDRERSLMDWALRWIWKHPEAAVVLSGMSSLDQVNENLKLADEASDIPWNEKDELAIRKARSIIEGLQAVNCTTCGYCMPCPEGINIPRSLSLFNDHHVFNDTNAGKRYRMILSERERASSCIQCGECLEKCPQNILIPDELKRVAELFESG